MHVIGSGYPLMLSVTGLKLSDGIEIIALIILNRLLASMQFKVISSSMKCLSYILMYVTGFAKTNLIVMHI